MLRTCLLVLAIGAFAPVAMAQSQATPATAFARFIELANTGGLGSPEGQALLTGEAKAAATNAVSALPAPERVVTISSDKAAAHLVFKGADGLESDAYFYLERTDDAWRVSAFRQMAMTDISYVLLREMNKQATLSPADQDEKRNLELLLSSNRQLRAWFAANQPALDALAQTADRSASDPAIQLRLKALGISVAQKVRDQIVLTIGGAVDNTVGILRAGPSGPPTISPSEFIWVEPLGDGWYLFRTT
ncbi:MAG TPA: hypothetical protein VGO52_16915 [Hyphomonadaceae bacterium]|jgi:hypothetical protein|nr:hypothetical protein [Hyphomonadaceae bacterium]